MSETPSNIQIAAAAWDEAITAAMTAWAEARAAGEADGRAQAKAAFFATWDAAEADAPWSQRPSAKADGLSLD